MGESHQVNGPPLSTWTPHISMYWVGSPPFFATYRKTGFCDLREPHSWVPCFRKVQCTLPKRPFSSVYNVVVIMWPLSGDRQGWKFLRYFWQWLTKSFPCNPTHQFGVCFCTAFIVSFALPSALRLDLQTTVGSIVGYKRELLNGVI